MVCQMKKIIDGDGSGGFCCCCWTRGGVGSLATFAAYSLAVRSGRGIKGGDKDVVPSLFIGMTTEWW
jgi:hypothetical protein